MGLFNSVYTKNGVDIQYKVGDLFCKNFEIGDSIDVEDGIYVCHEGMFAVVESKIAAAFGEERIFDKWGGQYRYDLQP